MPSMKMKTKSSGDLLTENKSLHVCQKSSKISKNSVSHTRNFQHEAELDTCPNKQDDSSCNNSTVQEHPNCCEMDHTANCSSTIETIFSPILESIDIDIEPEIYNYGGKKWRENDLIFPSYGDNDIDDSFVSSSITGATCLLDESNIFSGDEYLLLPFLEDSIETNSHYEDSNIYMAIHQLKTCNQESDVNSHPDWDPSECLDPKMFIRNLLDLPKTSPAKSITLVLDLDETLVHSSLDHCDNADFTFPVFSRLKEHTIYVKQRPHLRAFLEKVSQLFHIVIFTASQSIYAKKLLDILDPDGNIISRRAYRDSCIFEHGGYTKDLTVLGVDLAKIVIIDNSPQVFRLQVNNGIPIKSWFDDPSDCALISLLPFLETLVDVEDVRPLIAKRFGNKE